MMGINVARVENSGDLVRSPTTFHQRVLIGDIKKYQVMFLDQYMEHIILFTSRWKNIACGKISLFHTLPEPFIGFRGGCYDPFGTTPQEIKIA